MINQLCFLCHLMFMLNLSLFYVYDLFILVIWLVSSIFELALSAHLTIYDASVCIPILSSFFKIRLLWSFYVILSHPIKFHNFFFAFQILGMLKFNYYENLIFHFAVINFVNFLSIFFLCFINVNEGIISHFKSFIII